MCPESLAACRSTTLIAHPSGCGMRRDGSTHSGCCGDSAVRLSLCLRWCLTAHCVRLPCALCPEPARRLTVGHGRLWALFRALLLPVRKSWSFGCKINHISGLFGTKRSPCGVGRPLPDAPTQMSSEFRQCMHMFELNLTAGQLLPNPTCPPHLPLPSSCAPSSSSAPPCPSRIPLSIPFPSIPEVALSPFSERHYPIGELTAPRPRVCLSGWSQRNPTPRLSAPNFISLHRTACCFSDVETCCFRTTLAPVVYPTCVL
ncbi:hypothetical protein EX30DRAFT_117284 [Ascodesmis nigricans]|uniref:Uncharacterized protein n=1 Tax=Ascodesmis nigricans TaxID=341454 RepID=A0A4S2MPX2_9PEZI|nr:hypothetical protein EX30DRAFT_117284 [Ascodesmis nigricans]